MQLNPFQFASIPHIIFGAGKLKLLEEIIPKFGSKVLIVIGAHSLKQSGKWDVISTAMDTINVEYDIISVKSEPSPSIIDEACDRFRNRGLDLIVGVGGGSVTDAGKAISAMLTKEDSIKNYLEGVGTKLHDGKKVPYIAIPTTSGTGSEATKNAVISQIGPHGFKKSLRHDNFIPDYAIIDPELMLSCPPSITAACGMDAFTQLLEAYVSTNANPMTDALAYSGIRAMKDSILQACGEGSSDLNFRSQMAYGSLMSGITLANAGLGIVHGLASPIGAFYDIPHGVICGTLLAEATKLNIKKLRLEGINGKLALKKHAEIGLLLVGEDHFNNEKINEYCDNLISSLENWIEVLNIDRLGKYGISEKALDKILDDTSMKNNPVSLNNEEIRELVITRI